MTDPTSHFDRTSQYHRPSVVKGNAATCPCCLKFHEVITSGLMVRHGWKEQGRRVGEYGMGFQWGNCHGWSLRPLEETDADALTIIGRIEGEMGRVEQAIADYSDPSFSGTFRSRDTKRVYGYHQSQSESAAMRAFVEAMDMETSVRDTTVRVKGYRVTHEPAVEFTFVVARGFEGREITKGEITGESYERSVIFRLPSWEQCRKNNIALLQSTYNGLREGRDALIEAVEDHRANPSSGKAADAPVVHRTSKRGVACGSKSHSRLETSNNDEVTCTRCAKKLVKWAEARAAKEADTARAEALVRFVRANGPQTAKSIKAALNCDQKQLNRALRLFESWKNPVTVDGFKVQQQWHATPSTYEAVEVSPTGASGLGRPGPGYQRRP